MDWPRIFTWTMVAGVASLDVLVLAAMCALDRAWARHWLGEQ